MRAASLSLVITVLLLAGCATAPRTRSFEPTQAGATAAAERILSLPSDMHANLEFEMYSEPAGGFNALFEHLDARRVEELERGSNRAFFCAQIQAPADCVPVEESRAIIHFFSSGRGEHQSQALAATIANLQAVRSEMEQGAQDRFSRHHAYLMAERSPEPASENHSWDWSSGHIYVLERDFVCANWSVSVSCRHRLDVRRMAVVDHEADEPVYFESTENLVLAYEAALAQADGDPRSIQFEIRDRAGAHLERGYFRDVQSLDAAQICGRVWVWGHIGSETDCIPLSRIARFKVRDRMRSRPELAVDAVLIPFRFLGAVAQTAAMGGGGG